MERQYVGIDLHRRSSTIYRMAEDGEVLGCVRIPSQPSDLARAMAEAGPEPRSGPRVHLRLVLGSRSARRARCARAPRPRARQQLGEPPGEERRAGREGPRCHAPPRASGRGLDRPAGDERAARAGALPVLLWSGTAPARRPRSTGSWRRTVSCRWWARCGAQRVPPSSTTSSSPKAYTIRIESLRDLLELYDREITMLDGEIHTELKDDPGYRALLHAPRRRARSSPRSSWPRSATSPDSTTRRSSAPGPGSPRSTESRTRPCTAARSPSRDHRSSAGRPSRRSGTTGPRATRSCARTTDGSPNAGASTRHGWRSHASS